MAQPTLRRPDTPAAPFAASPSLSRLPIRPGAGLRPIVLQRPGGSAVSMEMSRAASYAFHALAYMAQQKTNSPVQSHRIAEERGIPKRFLLKVLKPLVDARILDSVKGPSGGYRLARALTEVSVLEVIEAADMKKVQ